MRKADLITAAVLIAGGVVVIWDALRLGIGWGTDGPKSGFFPFWLAVTMIACCAGIVVQSLLRADVRLFIRREAVAPVAKVLAPATIAVALMDLLGLYVASALYMGFYMRWIGRHPWPAVVGISAAFSLATFLVFEKWFLAPLPKGPLETWLGF